MSVVTYKESVKAYKGIHESLHDVLDILYEHLELLNTQDDNTKYFNDYIQYTIRNIFDANMNKYRIKVKNDNGTYYIYLTYEKENESIRYIVGRYKTTDKLEVSIRVLRYLIDEYCDKKTMYSYGNGQSLIISADSEIEDKVKEYNNNLKQKLLSTLPNDIRTYINEVGYLGEVLEYTRGLRINQEWF